jgi:pimeloyl-ACP methyl ester carboxylesterase
MRHISKSMMALATLGAATTLGPLLLPAPVHAQQVQDVKVGSEPLVLRSRGSVIIGGSRVLQSREQLSSITGVPPSESGHVTINQMYAEFMVPQTIVGLPIILVHGASLSGKTYDTTPDGRMGWYEYFVRKGHPTYVIDQSSRARSGADISVYNNVRVGKQPPNALPSAFHISHEDGLAQFRIGVRNGKPFADTQFPTQALDALAAQSVPDFNASLPQPNPIYANLAKLAGELGGAILLGHSEGAAYPLYAALDDPKNVKKMIVVEPGICRSRLD